jgi:hypothetical protein
MILSSTPMTSVSLIRIFDFVAERRVKYAGKDGGFGEPSYSKTFSGPTSSVSDSSVGI